jgi:3-oxoacyl-[acyl-carrier protein] reductase
MSREHGRVINQSSGAAYNYASVPSDTFPGLNAFNYQQTKWGVVGLTKFSAGQLGRWNITVNCIAPGVIATDATMKVVEPSMLELLAQQKPIPGVMNADDLTGAAVFFASDEARYVTGQVIVVDGGRHMPA